MELIKRVLCDSQNDYSSCPRRLTERRTQWRRLRYCHACDLSAAVQPAIKFDSARQLCNYMLDHSIVLQICWNCQYKHVFILHWKAIIFFAPVTLCPNNLNISSLIISYVSAMLSSTLLPDFSFPSLSFQDMSSNGQYPLPKFVTCCFQLFLLCDRQRPHAVSRCTALLT